MVKKILKIAAFILGPIIPLMVVIYFLFPYINEQQYEEIAEKYKDTPAIIDSSASDNPVSANSTNDINDDIDSIGKDSQMLNERSKADTTTIALLKGKIDSLTIENDSLKTLLTTKDDSLQLLRQELALQDSIAEAQSEKSEEDAISGKEFAENVKSLLSLDDENLAPIINELSDNELVRLYQGGSSRQRKKLLRTLQSKRAAKLMTEVM
ncbi:hypothetical protein [Fodinibius halophilus]|uniref:Magnesium transporter MgtE intracellular domain-containing protein n=1 Tax=Fodinibius halophilus TaxID=1736908 RepID=A0A6M1T0E4_9BACT|nr:hypothetical protein [Fodinibius halophilus]NGP87399.1 hypothetical protein [Fodinibius halophilus]